MPTNKLSAKVNDQFEFSAEQLNEADIIALPDGHFHILYQRKSYRATLVEANHQRKAFTVKINGSKYIVQLADRYDQMVERLGLNVIKQHRAKDITAPMPGLVLQIMVQVGDQVAEGDPLIILEAMKMENVIKAAGSGQVAHIEVTAGEAVEKGQLLLRMA
ncbi:MAG: biotin/lipoyl-binding protein [Bacteroidetes bacterium]|nr:MAG: biotin/lipoyl-binding protein [Bacteroidota bacterium]